MNAIKEANGIKLAKFLRGCSCLTCPSGEPQKDECLNSCCIADELMARAADLLEQYIDPADLSPIAVALIKYAPSWVNDAAKDLADYLKEAGTPSDQTLPQMPITFSFDAELRPAAFEAILGGPFTLRKLDEIGFEDPVTGETVIFHKERSHV